MGKCKKKDPNNIRDNRHRNTRIHTGDRQAVSYAKSHKQSGERPE